eukprot:6172816-Pleurochrysis_carterae.AAC.2
MSQPIDGSIATYISYYGWPPRRTRQFARAHACLPSLFASHTMSSPALAQQNESPVHHPLRGIGCD